MAVFNKAHGNYIEEVSRFPVSVTAVETAVPVFIGYTKKRRSLNNELLPSEVIKRIKINKPTLITSLFEFETCFGKGVNEKYRIHIDETYTLPDISSPPVLDKRLIKVSIPNLSVQSFYYHMQMYFANGGGPCYIISVGSCRATKINKANLLAGLKMSGYYNEPTLVVFPQASNLGAAKDAYEVYNAALVQAGQLKKRFVIIDCHSNDPETLRNSSLGAGTELLKWAAAYHPYIYSSFNYFYDVKNTAKFNITLRKNNEVANVNFKSLSAELKSLVRLELDKLRVVLPPGCAVAGIYANVDRTSGVWKSPANVSMKMVSGLTKTVEKEDQEGLNADPDNGKLINVIREFPERGVLLWGARTLAGNNSEWKYISITRFINMVEESCKNAAMHFVSEPNDPQTWLRVNSMIEDFLMQMWLKGALLGNKPEQAFFVAVGLNKTMTANDILEGRMIVEIGMACIRPAEFIILRFDLKMSES